MTLQEALAENAKVQSICDLVRLIFNVVYAVHRGEITLPERGASTPKSSVLWAPFFCRRKKPIGSIHSYTLVQIAKLLGRVEGRGKGIPKANRDVRTVFAYLAAFERQMVSKENLIALTKNAKVSKADHLYVTKLMHNRLKRI